VRILLVANDDDQSQLIRGTLAASTTPRFQVEYASSAWEAQRCAASDAFEAMVVDSSLSDTDSGTLLGRLKAIGVGAPALLLTPTDWDPVAAGSEDYLPKTEGLSGNSLVRAVLAMLDRHALIEQLTAERDRAERATAELAKLRHDLATPLGVVLGVTQALLVSDDGLDIDRRESLEDASAAAVQAGEILKRSYQASQDQVEPDAAPQPPPLELLPEAGRATTPGSRRMVLIADDDPLTRRLLSRTLASDQFGVLEAADGKEAWQLIREHHPAVAILDWQMPVYSGLELTDVIKSDPQVRGMTVIILTGRSAQADRDAGAQARADLYLIKPFDPRQVLFAVEQALGMNEPRGSPL
jgi:DNA-binding response OmpR family regulator